MKDIIWTIIVVWFIYKMVDVLRGLTSKKENKSERFNNQTANARSNNRPEESDIKKAVKNHLNNEGEYVDFEEIK